MKGYEAVLSFLHTENFHYEDSENSLAFKVQGANFIVFKNDSSFVGINQLLGSFDNLSRAQKLELCNSMNEDVFVVKFTLDNNDRVWSVFEMMARDNIDSDEWFSIFNFLDRTTDRYIDKANHL